MSGQDESRYQRAIRAFDVANAEDPHQEMDRGVEYPKQSLYARRMSDWLNRLAPDAPEAVRLAVRAQHIRRWEIPRESYPGGRQGYLRWRSALGRFHAEVAQKLLHEAGYDEEMVDLVGQLLRKELLKTNPLTQMVEDTACLVFLAHYYVDFAGKHEDAIVINILRRTWIKMSTTAHKLALEMRLSGRPGDLLNKALQT